MEASTLLSIMHGSRTPLLLLSFCLILVFDSLLSPNFQVSVHEFVKENGNNFVVDDSLTEEEQAILLGREIESLIHDLEEEQNYDDYSSPLEIMEEGFGGNDYDLNYITAQKRFASDGNGRSFATDSDNRSYHNIIDSESPLPPYTLKNVVDSTIIYSGALAILVYDNENDKFVLLQSKSHPWQKENRDLHRAFSVVTHLLRKLFPERFQGSSSAEFAIPISVGTFPHIKGTDCVIKAFQRGLETQPCVESHFSQAPILHFGNVFSSESVFPNIISMPKAGTQLDCFHRWAESKTRCEGFENLVYGKDDIEWEDLSPEVVWRGEDFHYMASVPPGQRLSRGGLRSRINKLVPVYEKGNDVPLAFQEDYSTLLSRWRGVLLTINSVKNSIRTGTAPWCNIKFNRYENEEAEAGYYKQWERLDKFGLPVVGNSIRQKELTKYRYHIDLGSDFGASWGNKLQQLAKPGLLFHHVSPTKTFLHDYAKPWVHYIPVDTKLDDLEAKFDWAESHPIEAKTIANQGTELVKFLSSLDGLELMFQNEIVAPLRKAVEAYEPLVIKSDNRWRKVINQVYGDEFLPIMKCNGEATNHCESLVGKKAFPSSNLKRKNCQIIYIIGVEGSNHHGLLPIVKNLADKQIDPDTGLGYHVDMQPMALKTGLFGWYSWSYLVHKWRFGGDPGVHDSALAQSVISTMCPNDGRRHVSVEWSSFPSGYIDEKRSYRVKRQEKWLDMSPVEIANDEKALVHPVDLNAFYDAYSPYAEIKFLVLNRDYTETIASHMNWDNSPEIHSNIISGFMIILSRFLNTHLFDSITGKKLWTILCLESIFAKNFRTQAEVTEARNSAIKNIATFFEWPVTDCPDCFKNWHESKKVPETLLGADNMEILSSHMSALDGVWPPKRADDVLPEQQCGLLTESANPAMPFHTPKPVKIYSFGFRKRGLKAQSMFHNGHLRHFGTGRIDYILEHRTDCNNGGLVNEDDGLCLAINHFANSKCSYDDLTQHYPKCRTMITNDEFCADNRYDARGYYSDGMKNSVYLPLGPRYDSWEALEAIMSTNGSTIVSSSQRKYAFNAIFSESTYTGRYTLADVIQRDDNTLSSFVHIVEYWKPDPNNPDNDLTDSTTYMQALLDSTFTLAPSGHNPECFRLYEAVEAGSIPVISLDNDYREHKCKDSLIHWLDSPIVVLDDWNDVIPTLQKLMTDPEALDQRQADMRSWYDQYMRNAVRGFESFLLNER